MEREYRLVWTRTEGLTDTVSCHCVLRGDLIRLPSPHMLLANRNPLEGFSEKRYISLTSFSSPSQAAVGRLYTRKQQLKGAGSSGSADNDTTTLPPLENSRTASIGFVGTKGLSNGVGVMR
jgi:hypothetical protein